MGRYSGKKCRLLSMFVLTAGYFLVEITVGYVTNSMALVADSFHMLSDVISLIIAFLSVKMSPKRWSKSTFGWARAEVLGALVNAVFLLALCFSIFVEALKRFFTPEEIHDPILILFVGTFGLIVNLVGLILFQGHSHHGHHGHSHGNQQIPSLEMVLSEGDINDNKGNFQLPPPLAGDTKPSEHKGGSSSQMNMHGVFLHILADALGSVIVIISALIIWLTTWEFRYYVDPALSVIMVLLIMHSTWPLLKASAMILLQTVPTHIQVDYLQKKLLDKVDGVLAVHEFHVWQLAGDRIIASAHICCKNLPDYMKIAEKVKEFFHNEGIHSTTIQPEFVTMNEVTNDDCALDCPMKTNCIPQTCCGTLKDKNSVQPGLVKDSSSCVTDCPDNLYSINGTYKTFDSTKPQSNSV